MNWRVKQNKYTVDILDDNDDVLMHIGGKTDEEKLKNAKLVAAAPDLLEALMRCKSDSAMIDSDSSRNSLKMAMAAIKKATE